MIFNNLDQLNQALPHLRKTNGRIMALDLGSKRIGVAVSDETRLIATPKLILQRQNNEKDFIKISHLITEYNPKLLVLGHPFDMDGSRIAMTDFSENFAAELNQFFLDKISILLFEERLTSFEARSVNVSGISARRGKHVDDIAASFILQHLLDVLRQDLSS